MLNFPLRASPRRVLPLCFLAPNRVEAQMEGAGRTVTSIAFIHRSYPLPSTASSQCRSGLDLSAGDVATVYHLHTARSENVLVYLRLRFRRLSGWIVVAAALHEAYLSPRNEYQCHRPPVPSSAGAYWPAVGEVGDGHGDALRDSSVKRGLRRPTMWMKNSRSHEW